MAKKGRKNRAANAILQELEELAGLQVKIGFQSGQDQSEGGVDIANIAAWNELGTEHIPSRPFMRNSVDNNEDTIKAMAQAQLKAVVGEKSAQEALQAIGVMQVGLVQNEIRNGNFEPNLPATIARKGSSTPLIDTGQMRQSVRYFIEEKGGGK